LARRYRDEQGGFDSEARQQLLRLKSVELYSESDSQQCPVCSQSIPETATTATDLLESIRQLDKQVAVAALEEPRLLEYITKLKAESDQLQKEIEGLDFRIEALAEQNRSLREQQHREMARGRTIGRASLFVESVAEVSVVDSSSRTQQLSLLRSEAAGLSAELDEESLRERLATLMAALSRQIVEMADRFELEHKGFGIRLDLRQLTLVVEQGGKSVPLSQIGSGENWVGYHLAFFLALHSWFRKLDRPVPAFLFIDQPTQAYFPAESDSEGNLAELAKDDDRIAVKRMFEIIVQVVSELAPKMQIILTDHADIAEDWFRDCVVQRWRNGNALIPVAWIERAEGASILSETEPSE
jgi:FtsZ-binding cell division protein ZapB